MRLLFPGVLTGSGSEEEIVYTVCPQTSVETYFSSESGVVVPLLTGAASTPEHPSHAGAGIGMPHMTFFPRQVKFGGCVWGGGG